MTDKTTKKTVSKASAGKQVKAAAAPAAAAVSAKPAAKTVKAPAKTQPKAVAAAPVVDAAKAAPKPAQKPKAPVSDLAPPWEDVARKAYELYERDGFAHGRDQDHWFQAEQELRGRSLT